MTEEESIMLNNVKNEFYISFSKLIAHSLNSLPKNIEDDAMFALQDMCSVYGSDYETYINKSRK